MTSIPELRIILAAVESPLVDASDRFCGDVPFVTVHRRSILDVPTDAVVSPANSYGFMDGGIDALYMSHFGHEIQTRVRRQIYDHHAGELLVGVADIVETGHDTIPLLIAAPTMRVPMVLRDSPNAYLAARAVFLLLQRGSFANGAFAGDRVADHVRAVALYLVFELVLRLSLNWRGINAPNSCGCCWQVTSSGMVNWSCRMSAAPPLLRRSEHENPIN